MAAEQLQGAVGQMLQSYKETTASQAPTKREQLQGAVRQLLQSYKETIHDPNPNSDLNRLLSAVDAIDIVALKEMKSKGIFSAEEIMRAAIDKDNVRVVEEFKEEIENVDEADGLGPLLDYSIEKRAMKTTRKLSGDLKYLGERAMPLFIAAIGEKDMDYVNELLDMKVVNLQDLDENPMHIAAQSSSAVMIQSFSSRNLAWANAKGKGGRTPLHVAAENGCKDVCEALLQHGANPDAKDAKGRTPLFCCAEKAPEGSLDCMEVLVKFSRSSIDEKNNDMLTPLHVAAEGRHKAQVKMLINHNAHLDIQTPEGETALELIASKVPSAIKEFKKRLDKGIRLEDPGNETKIQIDFRKLFSVEEFKARDGEGNLAMFLNLCEPVGQGSPVVGILEHPLVKTYLHLKMKQVQNFYWILIVCHFIFSIVFSVYAVLTFAFYCPPADEDRLMRRNFTSTVKCRGSQRIKGTIFASWVFLIIFTIVFILRESGKVPGLPTSHKKCWALVKHSCKFETLRNTMMIVLMVALICCSGPKPSPEVQRWEYYFACIASFLVWIEMLVMIGRVPMFGKYVQMYRSVCWEMIKFAVAYSSFLIGFMVIFMILFSDQEVFISDMHTHFLGVIGKVLVMMTGEFEYVELMYPETETLERSRQNSSVSPLGKNYSSWGEIDSKIDYNHFPGLSHLSVLGFIIFVGVVMMNLLLAIAVNDIKQLSKTAKRDQLVSQAELINYMERILGFWVFRKLLPPKIQDLFKAGVLNRGRGFTMTREVFYANNNDRSLPETLKNELYDFCLKSEENIRQGQDKKEKEIWRKTLEEKYDKLSDKCDKLAEDNQQMKLLLRKSADESQEMKVLLGKILSQTINIAKVKSTPA